MAKTFSQRSREIPSSEKAAFHQVTGAGRSHVKRPFFDVNDADIEAIVTRVEAHLTKITQEQP